MDVDDIDTPAVVVDLDVVERNLARAQAWADGAGLRLRPHVKTHKLPRLARLQMALGAVGITAQKLGEAEAMADGGLADILLPYNLLGAPKLARLRALAERATVSVTADSAVAVGGYAAAFEGTGEPLAVLVECDTGAARCGVQSPEEAVALARLVARAPGLRFAGILTYPPQGVPVVVAHRVAAIVAALAEAGLPPGVVSLGGTPDLFSSALSPLATEYRPGTYAYSDRMQVAAGHGTLADCALTVRATVVSRPTPDRAVLDAGSKALSSDRCTLPGHGYLREWPEAVVTSLSEEHAVVDLAACAGRPAIGDRVGVVPNHACVVTNLFDEVHLVRGGRVEEIARVTSRGRLG